MPIPEQIQFNEKAINGWMFNQRRIDQEQKLSLLPRRCYLSGKRLWFKHCEVVHCMVTGPGSSIFETYWCDPYEFLLHELSRQ